MSSWQQERQHISSIGGLVITFCCLMAFGTHYFLLASMACILFLLLLFRRKLSAFAPASEESE
jgi:predicted branched-subunit amino acid permease